ncbi:DNA topoisomerase IB, partial [Aegicerativicinus sediminis]
RDEKKRKQYRYHPIWNKIRNQTKFYRMSEFGLILPALREAVERDLRQKNWGREKVLALVVKLLEETHIRIGNQQYAKRNKTYGLSTLRKKHVNLNGTKIRFEFVGKKGKEHKITLRNKKLVRLINKSQEIPGWELFKYYDEEGERRSVDSSMINAYIQQLAGASFTAKDFRTWAATIIFFETLMEMGPSEDESVSKKNVLSAYDVAAKSLGNTRNVTRNYYVHPAVVSSYYNDRMFKVFSRVEKDEKEFPNFSLSEQAVLKIIKDFDPFQFEG